MKKIAFVLAVLLVAAPAWADVTIDANQVPDTNQVEISYFSDGNLPRAFGLDITVTDGNIVACTPAMVGECNDPVRGYGIFPGTIQIDAGGYVTDDGTPDAPPGATGALGGLDTNGITIELGSLYEGANEPPLEGLLCTITVTENCTVNITGNAARCGMGSTARGVVMVDWTEVPLVTYVPGDVLLDCFPTAHPDYDEWVAVGKPNSWCYKRQCHGDADNAEELIGKYYYWVGFNDLTIFLDNWTDKAGATAALQADFSHSEELIGKYYYRVGFDDLSIFLANWTDKLGSDPNCLDVAP